MMSIPVVVAILLCIIYSYWKRAFSYWRKRNIPGPTPVPFFGNIKDSVFRVKNIASIYKEIYDQYPNEKVVGIYRLTNPILIIRDLDIVKQLFIKDFDVFPERGIEFSKEGLGDNLFHCDNTTWKALRHHLTPLFTSSKLRNTVAVMDKYADHLINYLENDIAKINEREMHNIFQKYTMASTMAVSFGLDIDFFKENQRFIEKAAHYIFRTTFAAEIDMLCPNIWYKLNKSLYPKLVNDFCYEVIRIVTNEKNDASTNSSDLIGKLISMKKSQEFDTVDKEKFSITDHVIAGQVFMFFAAGFGNNALSLANALFQLAKHKHIQDKVVEEIDTVLAKNDGKLTYEAVKEMTYLDKVFLEILRVNTLTNAIQRSAKMDYTIPGTDIFIEKGTTVLVSPYAIHHDEGIYFAPNIFDPERFAPENIANRHPCAYLPFGIGPRSCLGRQLAKLQFVTALVRVFSKFRVEPSEKTKHIENYDPMSTFLATRSGVYVKLIPRRK